MRHGIVVTTWHTWLKHKPVPRINDFWIRWWSVQVVHGILKKNFQFKRRCKDRESMNTCYAKKMLLIWEKFLIEETFDSERSLFCATFLDRRLDGWNGDRKHRKCLMRQVTKQGYTTILYRTRLKGKFESLKLMMTENPYKEWIKW